MTQTATEVEVIEALDFHEDEECEMCPLEGRAHPNKATVYLWRPPCDHFPNGRVFAACKEWRTVHFPLGARLRVVCCPHVEYMASEVRFVGLVNP